MYGSRVKVLQSSSLFQSKGNTHVQVIVKKQNINKSIQEISNNTT